MFGNVSVAAKVAILSKNVCRLTTSSVLNSCIALLSLLLQHTPISALRAFSEGSRGEAKGSAMRLQLLDTPGPNEAGEVGLRHQVGVKIVFLKVFVWKQCITMTG